MARSTGVAAGALQACGAQLTALGFRKRSGAVYTRALAEETLGFLGLNSAANRPGGPYEINPVVGVRHQQLERVVAELSGAKPHGYIPPSISTPLGYLMPESRYRTWLFDDPSSIDDTSASLGSAVAEWTLPYLHEHDSLPKILSALSATKRATGDAASMRLSVAYALLGDSDRAKRLVQRDLDDLADRGDLAARYFRNFAAAILSSTYI